MGGSSKHDHDDHDDLDEEEEDVPYDNDGGTLSRLVIVGNFVIILSFYPFCFLQFSHILRQHRQ